ncbi:hypothetical protein D3C80_1683680 [compost metagenome]
MTAQVLSDGSDGVDGSPRLAAQGEDARSGGQQAGAVQLIERGKQLAQRQVTEAAEQRQGAGLDRM